MFTLNPSRPRLSVTSWIKGFNTPSSLITKLEKDNNAEACVAAVSNHMRIKGDAFLSIPSVEQPLSSSEDAASKAWIQVLLDPETKAHVLYTYISDTNFHWKFNWFLRSCVLLMVRFRL